MVIFRGLSNKRCFYATKGKKVRKKYCKTIDKTEKKWYHIYIIGIPLCLFAYASA